MAELDLTARLCLLWSEMRDAARVGTIHPDKMTTNIEVALNRLVQLVTEVTRKHLLEYEFPDHDGVCDAIAEEDLELFEIFGQEFVLRICEEVQESAAPVESARLQAMFDAYNLQYFAGALPRHIIQVVYDVAHWSANPADQESSGAIDHERRTITIGYTHQEFEASTLLHFLSHAAHPGSDDSDPRGLSEMDRLRKLGAPVDLETDANGVIHLKSLAGA
jgi:hypothetical protein